MIFIIDWSASQNLFVLHLFEFCRAFTEFTVVIFFYFNLFYLLVRMVASHREALSVNNDS